MKTQLLCLSLMVAVGGAGGGCTVKMVPTAWGPEVAQVEMAAVEAAAPMPTGGGALLAGPIINPGNGHIYYLLKPDTWTNCEALAVKLGGHLATVRNAEEQAWMVATFGPEKEFSTHSFWIGLHQDDGGRMVWASGEAGGYRNWGPWEPNGTGTVDGMCVFIGRYAEGWWNDTNDRNLGPNDGTPWAYYGPLPRGLVEIVPPRL